MGDFCYVFLLVFEENWGEMNISHGIFDVFMTKEVLDVEGVSGSPCLHCRLKAAEGFEAYLQ
jgi:hypothetical protein